MSIKFIDNQGNIWIVSINKRDYNIIEILECIEQQYFEVKV